MYEDLIKRLRNVSIELWQSDHVSVLLLEAADAIEELSRLHEAQRQNLITLMNEEPEPKWIPVTERLPEIDEKHHCSKDVLAYLKDGGMCFTALEENIFGQACFECERNPAVEEEMIVTHWMPLPEPPKEGE